MVSVIDTFGWEIDALRTQHPANLQHLLERVKPEGDQNRRAPIRERWWRHGWERPGLRAALSALDLFCTTAETSKHRVFVFLASATLPDNMLTAVAVSDALILGCLSSRIHLCWSLSAGGRLGVGNDPTWTNSTCFLPFPFPVCTFDVAERIRHLGEQLDAHRKRQQAAHPGLTITGMYNVLEKLRAGEELTAKERVIHEQGLVSVLKQIHDELDAAVFEAYGWPVTLTDEEILERLVALNHERAEEEKRGLVRWLRPEFQNPQGKKDAVQDEIPGTGAEEGEEGARRREPGESREAPLAEGAAAAGRRGARSPRRDRHARSRPRQGGLQGREGRGARRLPRQPRRPRPRRRLRRRRGAELVGGAVSPSGGRRPGNGFRLGCQSMTI